MALPLFAATAPGIWLDRLALIGVTLLPLWIVLGRRWRHGPAGADALPRNGTWEPPPALPVESSRPPWAASPGRISRRTGWTLLLLAAAGLAFWLQSTPWRHLGPPLTIDRAAAERIARAAWQERGVQLPPAARALISVTPRPGSVDRYVWQKVGSSGYEALLGTHVPVARWLVRFARFDGDVAERAEEWWCFVTGDGKVQRLRHTLPEARAGATLDESAARAIAERTLRERFGIDPTQWEKVSATSRQRPKRTDWTFLYRDPQFPRLKPGEARATVEVAGEEAIEAYRSIFVPEEWEREQRRASTVYRIGGTIRATALGLLLVAGLVVAVLAVTRRRIAVGLALGVAAVVVGARLIGLVNSWPSIVAGFSTTRPYDLQRLIGAAGPTVGALLAASALALIAGTAARWLRPPLPDRRAATGLGLLAGVIGVGLLALGAALAEVPAPDWPSFAGAEAWLPPLGAAPFIVSGYVAQTVVAVLVFGAVDRWSAGWSLRRGVAGAALGGAAALLFLGGEAPGIAAWCGSAALVGAGLVALYVLALRQDLTVLPLATGVVAIAGALAGAAPRHHPHAWTSALLGCVVVSLLAWTGFTALRALASRPTDPQVTPATPPPPPPLPPGA
jgi:hypothetical protein